MKRLSLALVVLFQLIGCARYVEPKFSSDLDAKVQPKASLSNPEKEKNAPFALRAAANTTKTVTEARGVYDGSSSSSGSYGWSNNLISISNSLFQYPSVKAVITVLLRNTGYYAQPYNLDQYSQGLYGGQCARVSLKLTGAATDTLARISITENQLGYSSWQQYSPYATSNGKAQFVSWTRSANNTTELIAEVSNTELEVTVAYLSTATSTTARTLSSTMTISPCTLQRYTYTNSTVATTTTATADWSNLVQVSNSYGGNQYSNYNQIAPTSTSNSRGDAQSIVKSDVSTQYDPYSYYCSVYGLYCSN